MDILYKSTRSNSEPIRASQAIVKGLAEDGGLFVPQQIPVLECSLQELAQMDYRQVAYEVMKLYFTDFTEEEKAQFASFLQRAIDNLGGNPYKRKQKEEPKK